MQLTVKNTLLAAVSLLAITATASPVAPRDGTNLDVRANSKLNQYPNADCKDNNGGNAPTFHASPPLRKCYDLDSTTMSFYFGLGPLTQTWAYAEAGCRGQSMNLGGKGGCQAVDANFSDRFEVIRSVMMD